MADLSAASAARSSSARTTTGSISMQAILPGSLTETELTIGMACFSKQL
jgi:hypothetical protein